MSDMAQELSSVHHNRRRRHSSSESPAGDHGIKYRRNGQLQACEPCRKSKLRCDHGHPHCGRCLRLKRQRQCVYEDAPMSKNRVRPEATLASPAPFSTPPPTTGPSNASTAASVASPTSTFPSGQARRSVYHHPGFLGVTSYDAVLTDHRGLAPEEPVQDSNPEENISPDRIQRGVEVLRLLKYTSHFIRFIVQLFKNCPGVLLIPPMTEGWARGIWDTWGSDLEAQDPEKMKTLSALIWKNSASPLIFDENTKPKEWIDLATGPNLRWEVVGIVIGIAKLCFGTFRDFDPIFSSIEEAGLEKSELSGWLVKSVEACVDFCRTLNNPTDLLIWLWFESVVVMYTTEGEGSFPSYMRAHETINLAVALGLHQEIKPSSNVPFFLTELRKRTFMCCYFTDLNLATFLGRPPRLSSRYCALSSPLDLSQEELWCDDEGERARILSGLDENGWNKAGKVHRISWTKWMYSGMRLREEVLEISLGISNEDIKDRAEAVSQKAKQFWATLPEFMRSPDVPGRQKPAEYIYTLFVTQEYHYNDFLLQRALIRRCSVSVAKLVQVSQAMLSRVLEAISRRDFLADYQLDLEYIHVAYGLPSAAVLAIELLKQENERYQQLQPPYSTDAVQRSFILPRSDTIQALSVFVSSLGYVDRTQFATSASKKGRQFLKHVLDKILDPPPPPRLSNETAGTVLQAAPKEQNTGLDIMGQFSADNGYLDAPYSFESDSGFVQWLENMDWVFESEQDKSGGIPSMCWKPTFTSL